MKKLKKTIVAVSHPRAKSNASAGNRTPVESMATIHHTTGPLMLVLLVISALVGHYILDSKFFTSTQRHDVTMQCITPWMPQRTSYLIYSFLREMLIIPSESDTHCQWVCVCVWERYVSCRMQVCPISSSSSSNCKILINTSILVCQSCEDKREWLTCRKPTKEGCLAWNNNPDSHQLFRSNYPRWKLKFNGLVWTMIPSSEI